jgi:hypothetical protein
MRIGRRAELRLAAAEHLRASAKLRVNFQPDGGDVLHFFSHG